MVAVYIISNIITKISNKIIINKHKTKKGRVTIAGKLSKDVPKGTLNSILKQADLKEL